MRHKDLSRQAQYFMWMTTHDAYICGDTLATGIISKTERIWLIWHQTNQARHTARIESGDIMRTTYWVQGGDTLSVRGGSGG
jgi:hypothetical protein